MHNFLMLLCLYPFPLFRYHHTGPVTAFYSLREGLAVLVEEVKTCELFGLSVGASTLLYRLPWCTLYRGKKYTIPPL